MSQPNIDALLSRMTLREKAGQMTQVTIDTLADGKPYKVKTPLRLNPKKMKKVLVDAAVGSVLNVGTSAHTPKRWRAMIDAIQERASQTRLGIPVLYGIDTIHGASYVMNSTLFPQQLGLAATYDADLVADLFELAARDTVWAGIPWLFSPVADVGRHPAWPRLWEGFGEDVYQCGVMTRAATEGIQRVKGAASCLKHFLGYGVPLSGKDRTPAWIPDRQLKEYFLPPFLEGIDAGAPSIMVNSGEVNGVPVHANRQLLTDLLRKQLKFKGVLVTDWEDILYLHTRHRVADSYRSAVKMAIDAGIDMSMTPIDVDFIDHVVDLVESGELTEKRINASVRRILILKKKLGLFKTPNPGHVAQKPRRKKDLKLAVRAAEESVVLLRNNDYEGKPILPLNPNKKVLVTGPTATSKRSLHGGWTYTWQGEKTDELDPERHPDFLAAMRKEWGKNRVVYFQGCDQEGNLDLKGFKKATRSADTIILCLGESSYTEFFGSLDDMRLPREQEDLAKAALASGLPVVLLLLQGRPRCISNFADDIPAVLTAFYPGHGGPRAMAKILSGRVNPSGRLPLTYPRHPNELVTYDHKSTENQELQGAKSAYDPEFDFGHGLSYGDFHYGKLRLSAVEIKKDEQLKISVTVTNKGKRGGGHVVQLFTRDHYASITPSVKRLRGFQRIYLEAGEKKKVKFKLTAQDLAFVGVDGEWVTETGTFSVMIGPKTKEFTLE